MERANRGVSCQRDPESLRDHIKEVISAYTLDRRLWPKARAGQFTHEVVFDGRAGRVGLHQKHFAAHILQRAEQHTSELQSLMRTSYAVFCLKKKTNILKHTHNSTSPTPDDNSTKRTHTT